MLDKAAVDTWLARYVAAWKSYDPQAIGALFSEDAAYIFQPFEPPVKGRAGIVSWWLAEPDPTGTYDARYHTLMTEDALAVANGRTIYYEADGVTRRAVFDNVFFLRFNDAGECVEFREWWMEDSV